MMPGVLQRAMYSLVGGFGFSTVKIQPDTPIKEKPVKTVKKHSRPKLTERDLIQMEIQIGRSVFGAVPAGRNREFFNYDPRTWIWHEVWIADGRRHEITVRYEVHSRGVLKILPGGRNSWLTGQELENLVLAAESYHERVIRHIYRRDPATGKKLV